METNLSDGVLSCTVCFRSFKRLDHLQRHIASHDDSRPFQCSFCSVNFGRRDALLRHWRTCKQRTISGSSVPEIQRQKRGRKRISCDACVRSKRKCNRASPCSMCQHFGETCILTQQVNCYVATRPGSITSSTDSPQSSSTSPASTGLATSISAEESGSDGSVSLSPDHNLFMSDEFLSNAITVQPSDYTHFGAWDTTNAINAILGSPISLLPTPPYPVPHMRLNFLSKFTATTGFARSFECGNETERKQIMTALVSTTPRSKIELEIDAFLHVPDEDCLVNVVDDSVNIFESAAPQYLFDNTAKTQTQTQTHYPIIVQDPIYKHPLTLKSREIIGAMYQMITGDSPDTQGGCISNNWSKFEDECRIFFAPEKLERYLVAFWSLWYPNWPAFHKPTFSSTEKPAKLLAAMALIGASLTSDKTEHVQARRWGFAIERWIFSSHELGGDFLGEDSKHQETVCRCKLGGLLDELRACYAMMLFMTWEGTAEQKSRARRLRFSQIIDMSRRLIRLNPNRGSPAAFIKTENLTQGWKEFIFQEELARTLVYVFMIDCAYTLFNNCSPRLGLQELNIPLVCPEICFQAEDANTWNIHLQAWANSRIGKTNPLFSDILRILMKNELPHEQWRLLYEMSSLNFFVIANAFHSMLFHHRHGIIAQPESTKIMNALRNYKQAWQCREAVLGNYEIHQVGARDAWRRIGFMKYVMEYWRLALILFRHNESICNGPKEKILERFDETDMTQVHDLILKFQDVNLGEYEL